MDKVVDAINNLTINEDEYYKPNTANSNDARGNLAHNPETVTPPSNKTFEQKLLSYWTIPVFPLPTNPGIDQGFVAIKLTPQTLLTPATKEIVVDAAAGGA